MSKRRLLKLVVDKHVNGWDDPRLPTLNGFRRRGYTAEAIHKFCETIGISRNENFISTALLEHCCRTALEPIALRAMVVEDPVKVIIDNYPADKVETLKAPNHPKDASKGEHDVVFSRIVYLSRSDIDPSPSAPKDFYGLAPGREVHLKYAYNIKCDRVDFAADGKTIVAVHATVDTENKTKCKGKITWAASPSPSTDAKPLEVELRLYDHLFKSANPMALGNEEWLSDINPDSLTVVKAYADPSVAKATPRSYYQFERNAFFMCDDDSKPDHLIFNRTVMLKESKVTDKPKVAVAPAKKK